MDVHLFEIQSTDKTTLGFVMATGAYVAAEAFKKAADRKAAVLTVKTQEKVAVVDNTFESLPIVFDTPSPDVPESLVEAQAELAKPVTTYKPYKPNTYTPPLPAGSKVATTATTPAKNPASPAGTGSVAAIEPVTMPRDLAMKANALLKRMSFTTQYDKDVVADFDDIVFPKVERDFIVTVRGLEHSVEKFSEKGLKGVDLDGKFLGLSLFLEELVLPNEDTKA